MKNDATSFSPHFFMFGWHPRLSIDALLGPDSGNEGAKDYQTYVKKLRDRLQYSYKVATEETRKNADRDKEIYNSKV
jgi:hypothetical protein